MPFAAVRRPAVAGLTTILLGVGATLLPSSAEAAATTPDCSTGKVVLDKPGKYDLAGACSTVVVDSPYVTIDLATAHRIIVRASGAKITVSDHLGSLATTRGAGGATVTAPRVRLVSARGGTLRLIADRVTTLRSAGPYARVTVHSARRAIIPGETSTLHFTRLARLTVGGTRNMVRVEKGSTRVRDTGYRNRVRVHHRLPT